MKNKHLALMGILILNLILASGGFAAGYIAIQHFFALPEDVEEYISMVKEGELPVGHKGSFGTGNSVEASGMGVFLDSSFVRLDLYVVLGEDRAVTKMVIGKLDAAEGMASLITVPQDVKIILSDGLYQRLTAEYPAIPQLFQLEVLPSYAEPEKMGGIIADIFHDLGICDFDGIWVLGEEQVSGWLDCSQELAGLTEEAESYLNLPPVQKQALQALKGFAASLEEENIVKQEKTEFSMGISMDTYAETLAALNASSIRTELIDGCQEAEGYQLDIGQAARRLWKGKER